MEKSKYFEILSTFDKNLLHEIQKLIQTEGNQNAELLCKHLINCINNNQNNYLITKEYIINYVFKNKLDERKLQKLLNDGVKACEKIIVRTYIENDKNKQHLILTEYYQKKKLEKYFHQQVQLLSHSLSDLKENNYNNYNLYRLEYMIVENDLKNNLRGRSLQKLYNLLLTFYEIEQTKLKCVALNNLHYDLNLLPIENILYKQYNNVYKLFKSLNKIEYNKHWSDFLINAINISDDELRVIVNIYYNICINQLNQNNVEYYEHLLNAYIFSLEKNIAFEENGLLLPSHFKNIVTISLRLNKIDFAYEFVIKYKDYLPIENKEEIYNYNLAHIYFYQKKYDDVLTLLVQVKFTDVFYKISSRILQIKTYAELMLCNANYEDVLESSLNAFKKYIYINKEINETYATNFKNFYKVLNKIISITKDEYESYSNEIKHLKPLPEVEWLLSFMKRKYK